MDNHPCKLSSQLPWYSIFYSSPSSPTIVCFGVWKKIKPKPITFLPPFSSGSIARLQLLLVYCTGQPGLTFEYTPEFPRSRSTGNRVKTIAYRLKTWKISWNDLITRCFGRIPNVLERYREKTKWEYLANGVFFYRTDLQRTANEMWDIKKENWRMENSLWEGEIGRPSLSNLKK